MSIKVVVFDLYNTLIEIKVKNHYFMKLYRLSVNGFNMDFMDYINLTMKHTVPELIELLPNDFQSLYFDNIVLLNQELASIDVYAETVEVLKSLRNRHKVYLISNLASPYKKPVYSLNLEQYFSDVMFSCDYGVIKPDIDIFKIVEKKSGCSGEEILMIGDSEKSDIRGAQNMKWRYLKIDRSKKQSEKYIINDLKEVGAYITKCVNNC